MLADRLAAQLLTGPPARDPLAVAERLLAIQAQDLRGALLAERERSVLDAASAVGFDSLSGFDRAFLRLTGERPREYRRRVQT